MNSFFAVNVQLVKLLLRVCRAYVYTMHGMFDTYPVNLSAYLTFEGFVILLLLLLQYTRF